MNTVKEQFDAAVSVVKSVDKSGGTFQPSTTMMLTFYAFYKQATQGTCNTTRPPFYDVVGRAKWDSWNQLGNMCSEEAMKEYVNELKKIVEIMPQTEVVQHFISKIGNFYELVDDNDAIGSTIVQSNKPDRDDLQSNHRGDDGQIWGGVTGRGDVKEEESIYHNGFLSKSVHSIHLNGKIPSLEEKVNGLTDNGGVSEESEEEGDDDDDKDDDDDDDDKEEEEEEEDDKEDDDKCASNNNIIKTKENISSDGDDEYCDTVDVPFHQEEGRYFHRPTSVLPEICRKSVTFQKQGRLDKPVKKLNKHNGDVLVINKSVNDDVLMKINKAIGDLQKNAIQLERDMAELRELREKQVEIIQVFDFLHKFRIPCICFVALWPVVVNVLFRKFSRRDRF